MTHGRYAGSFTDNELFVAYGAVHDLVDRKPSHESVIKLQRLLNDASKLIPFSTLTELKRGWRPHQTAADFWKRALWLLLASIGLMIVTTQLTYKYNKGSAILVELQELSSSDVRERFNSLIRDYMQARTQLDVPPPTEPSTDLDFAWPAFVASEAELASLSDRLAVGSAEAQRFVAQDARFLIWPSRQVYCLLSSPPAAAGDLASFVARQVYSQDCGWAKLGELPPPAQQAPHESAYQQAPAADCWPEDPNGDAGRDLLLTSFTQTSRSLACAGVISFPPENFPGFHGLISEIRQTLTFLGLGILPALYGALGAIIYYMRMLLDPLRPNPPLSRVLHRGILGALAGIVLSWLFIPDSAVGEVFSGVGFSLFVVAFLFGFSLDVFFALLDRFVNRTVAAIGRTDPDRTEDRPQARPAPQADAPRAHPPRNGRSVLRPRAHDAAPAGATAHVDAASPAPTSGP